MGQVRLATLADVPAVGSVVREAYSPYIARMGRAPGPMLDDYTALIGAGRVHVAERDGMIKGVLVVIPEDGAMLLDNIAVAPYAQGTGLGRVLLNFAESLTRKAGMRRIKLYTNVMMTENVILYLRVGYVETERREDRGFYRVYMEKMLDQ